MKRIILLLFVVLTWGTVQAATRTTTGNSTNWNATSAWSGNKVPDVVDWPYDIAIVTNNMSRSGNLFVKGNNRNREQIVVQNNSTLSISSNTLRINNSTVRVKAGSRIIVNNLLLENNANIIVEQGATLTVNNTISMSGGGDMTANGIISAGGGVTLGNNSNITVGSNANMTFNSTLSVSGSGGGITSTGTISIASTVNIGNGSVNVNGGTVDLGGNITVVSDGRLRVNSGDFNVANNFSGTGSGGTVVGAGANLNVGNTLSLTNDGKITGGGRISWVNASVSNSGVSSSYIGCADGVTRLHGNTVNDGTSLNSKSNFSIELTPCALTLPVELLYTKGEVVEGDAVISWATIMELNNDYFTIEKSYDGENWETIGEVDGAGDSQEIIHYSFIDENIENRVVYYQIKQTDFDGKFSYSNIVSVFEEGDLRIYPNPSTGYFNVALVGGVYSKYEVYDIRSSAIVESVIEETTSLFGIDLSEYSKGIYLVKFYSSQGVTTKKIIVE